MCGSHPASGSTTLVVPVFSSAAVATASSSISALVLRRRRGLGAGSSAALASSLVAAGSGSVSAGFGLAVRLRGGVVFAVLRRRAGFLAVPNETLVTERLATSTEPRAVRDLDVALLDDVVFRDILGIDLFTDVGEDTCDFHHAAHIAMQKARSKDVQLVVLSNPIALSLFWQLTESQGRIPAHGFRFFPDVKNGMVMNAPANF